MRVFSSKLTYCSLTDQIDTLIKLKGVLPNFEGAIFIILFHKDNHKTPIQSIQMKNFSLLTKKQHFKLQQSGPPGWL